MTRFALAIIALMFITATCEAGLFRKRNGDRRTPVRSVLRGGCAGGSCHR